MEMFGHIFHFPLLHLQDFEGWVGGVQCFSRVVFSRILEVMQWSSLSQATSENDALMSHASPLSPPSNSCSILHTKWAESVANRKRMGEKSWSNYSHQTGAGLKTKSNQQIWTNVSSNFRSATGSLENFLPGISLGSWGFKNIPGKW